ncbi:iron-sulfur cluster assembly scaffold protein [Patescibacteria group bacterium]|nr:iron-sulfur cluster assembly scaffold protein [Patescibacteria group bacterium]
MEKGIPSEMYKEHIIELYKSPRNLGCLENSTHKATEHNSLCGDEITINLIVDKGKVKEAKFSGSGCIISMVSSSLLTEKIKNMELEEIKKMGKKDMLDLLKIDITPARIKCALLPLETTKKALGF